MAKEDDPPALICMVHDGASAMRSASVVARADDGI